MELWLKEKLPQVYNSVEHFELGRALGDVAAVCEALRPSTLMENSTKAAMALYQGNVSPRRRLCLDALCRKE